jgi:site-specific DNA-cytosine methylase
MLNSITVSRVALDAGAPTLRKRVFVLGFEKSTHIPTTFWDGSFEVGDVPVVRHALDGLPFDIHSDW